MKITYLKRINEGVVQSIIKITDNGILEAKTDCLLVMTTTLKVNESAIVFIQKMNYITATKQEFDNFYIDTVRNINELSKL